MLQFKKGILTITTSRSTYILDNKKQQYYNCTTKKLLQTAPLISANSFETDKEENDIFVLYLSRVIRDESARDNTKSVLHQLRKYVISLEKFIRIASNNGYQLEYNNGGLWIFFKNCDLLAEELQKNKIYKSWNDFFTIERNSGLEIMTLLNHFLDDYIASLRVGWVQEINNSISEEWIKRNSPILIEAAHIIKNTEDRKVFLYYYYTQLGYLSDQSINIHNYIAWCREMGKAPKKVNNFLKEFGETSKAIEQWREKALDEKISKNMDKIREKLFYEDDEFITMLPTTNQELVKEGNDMHHCVGSYGQKVADKKSYIVFIRKKESPDKCYITAEVRPNGKIGQYYLAYDHIITEDKDVQFHEKYQKHLKKTFSFNS